MIVFAIVVAIIWAFLYFGSFESYHLRHFCKLFGHRWYFYIATVNLRVGERHCNRCGRMEHTETGRVFEKIEDRSKHEWETKQPPQQANEEA